MLGRGQGVFPGMDFFFSTPSLINLILGSSTLERGVATCPYGFGMKAQGDGLGSGSLRLDFVAERPGRHGGVWLEGISAHCPFVHREIHSHIHLMLSTPFFQSMCQ